MTATSLREIMVEVYADVQKNQLRRECALVGAISLARAIADEQLSREILKTVTLRLKNPGA